MSFPCVNPFPERPKDAPEWLRDSSSTHILYGCVLTAVVSAVAAVILRSAFFAMFGCVGVGFLCGCLAKKQFAHYNCMANLLAQAYRVREEHKSLPFVVLGIILVASLIFPLIAGTSAIIWGAYCGALYV